MAIGQQRVRHLRIGLLDRGIGWRGVAKLKGIATETVTMPTVDPFVAPILYAIPVQMLAYHVAVLKGTDVDQPRNLAKSVTVE